MDRRKKAGHEKVFSFERQKSAYVNKIVTTSHNNKTVKTSLKYK